MGSCNGFAILGDRGEQRISLWKGRDEMKLESIDRGGITSLEKTSKRRTKKSVLIALGAR